MFLLDRARLALSSVYAKLTGCWLWFHIYCTDIRVESIFSSHSQKESQKAYHLKCQTIPLIPGDRNVKEWSGELVKSGSYYRKRGAINLTSGSCKRVRLG